MTFEITWRRSSRGAHVVNASTVSRLRDLVTFASLLRFGRISGRFNGDGGAVSRCYFELRARKMAPTRVILMSCGSYNPPTNMHLRMFGTYITVRHHFFRIPSAVHIEQRMLSYFVIARDVTSLSRVVTYCCQCVCVMRLISVIYFYIFSFNFYLQYVIGNICLIINKQ